MKHLTYKKWAVINLSMLLILVASICFALFIGAEKINLVSAIRGIDSRDAAILFTSRLPRVLLAVIVGLALSSSGGAFQALLRNPLADPFILGVSGGAALGSVLAIGLHLPFESISIAAFLAALLTMLLIFAIARTKGRLPSHTLLLTGVIFNAFCFALILFINALVTREQAYQIIFLLVGNLEATDYKTILVVALFVITGFVTIVVLAQKMNVLVLGDEQASQLGINANQLRFLIFVACSLMVGASVAVSGLIGFVGLFIPHIIRLMFGPDHRLLIPASGILGAAFLVTSDALSRTLLINTSYGTELPVGVITALIGAPCFVYLLKKQQKMI